MQNKPLIGAEIGTAEGRNAESILETLNMKKLYLIDPYLMRQRGYLFQEARARVERFKSQVDFIRKTSDEAVNDVPDLDFVYIDGDHSYLQVKRDIENYFPKVKNGGVIGGHDFGTDFLGVAKAVLEFWNGPGLMAKRSDWWILKPSSLPKATRTKVLTKDRLVLPCSSSLEK
jgi:hypothetical protein